MLRNCGVVPEKPGRFASSFRAFEAAMVGSERWQFGGFCQGWLKSGLSLRFDIIESKNKTHDACGKSLSVDPALFHGPFQPWKLHPRRGVAKPWAKQQGRKSNVPNPILIGIPNSRLGYGFPYLPTFTSVIADFFLLVLYHVKCHDTSCPSKNSPKSSRKSTRILWIWWSSNSHCPNGFQCGNALINHGWDLLSHAWIAEIRQAPEKGQHPKE